MIALVVVGALVWLALAVVVGLLVAGVIRLRNRMEPQAGDDSGVVSGS